MLKAYEAWQSADGKETTFATAAGITELRSRELLSADATLLYRFEAHTYEEANAIHCLRMGWDPYKTIGPSQPCPKCGAQFYPEDSGECWQCGETW